MRNFHALSLPSKSIALAILFLFLTSSCKEENQLLDPSNLPSNGDSTEHESVVRGPARSLVLTGPTSAVAGVCTGPFTVKALDENGIVAQAFESGSQWEMASTGAMTLYSDSDCNDAIADRRGEFSGLPLAQFSIKVNQMGAVAGTMNGPQSLSATFSLDVVAGPAAKAAFATPSSVSQGECVGISLNVTDAFDNAIAMSGDFSWSVNGGNTFSDSACANAITSLLFNADSSRDLYFRATSAGTATIDLSAAGLETEDATFSVLAAEVHRLKLFADASAVVGTCVPFRAEAQRSSTDSSPIFVSLGTVRASGMPIFSGNQCADPLGSENVPWAENSSSVTFYVSITAPGSRTLEIAADGLVSDTKEITWVAGAPHHFAVSTVPSGKANQVLGPVTVTLEDRYGNTATAPTALQISLSASGEASELASFHRSASQGDRTTSLTIPIHESSSVFHFQAVQPGALVMTLTATGLVDRNLVSTIAPPDPEMGAYTLTGPAEMTAGGCSEFLVSLKDKNGIAFQVTGSDLAYLVTGSSAEGTFHRDADCAETLSSPAIAVGTSSAKFYYRDTKARDSISLLARSGDWSSSTGLKVKAAAPAAAVLGRSLAPSGQFQCLELPYSLEDTFGNEAKFASDVTLDLESTRATFSRFAGCAEPVTGVVLAANAKTFTLYARPTQLGNASLKISLNGTVLADNGFLVNPMAPVELALTAESPIAGNCVPVTIQFQSTEPPSLVEPLVLHVTSDPQLVNFWARANCAPPQSTLDVSVTSFQAPASFFFRATLAKSYFFDVVGGYSIHGGRSFVVAPRQASKLVYLSNGSATVFKGIINGPYTLEAQDEFGNPSAPSARSVQFSSSQGEDILYSSDAAGTQSGAAFTGAERVQFYFKPEFTGQADIVAAAGDLGSATRNFQVEKVAELAFVSEDQTITSYEAGTLRLGDDAKIVALSLKNISAAAEANTVSVQLPEGGITRASTSTCPSGSDGSISASQTCTLVLEIQPDSLARTGGIVHVTYRNQRGEQATDLNLHFTVRESTAANLSGPTELAFGDVNIGSSKELPFSLTNSGDLAPGEMAIASDSPAFVPTIDSLSGKVVFTPVVNEEVTGKITVTYGTKSVEFNVKGRGRKTPILVYSVTTLNLGNVISGDTKTAAISIRNDGDLESGTILVTAPTGAFSLSGTFPEKLAAGQSADLTIRFAPQATGSYAGVVKIKEGESAESEITLAGVGQTLAVPVLTPDSQNFELVMSGQSRTLIAFLKNNGDLPYDLVTSEKTGSTSFSVTYSGCIGLAPGAECAVNVTYAPTGIPVASTNTASISSDSGTLRLKATTNNVDRLSNALAYQGQGSNGANLSVTPTSLAFGAVTIGQSKSLTLTLRNWGPVAADTFSVAFPAGLPLTLGTSTCATLAVGATCTMEVIYQPTSTAVLSGKTVISLNNGAGPAVLNVALSGSGALNGKITVSAGSYDFGKVVVGNTGTVRAFTLRNVSTSPIETISFTVPTGFTKTATTCTRLTANQTCTVSLAFSPVAAGPLASTLTINYGAEPMTGALMELKGTGDAPALFSVTPSPLNVGKHIVGIKSAAYTVALRNEGAATATGIVATVALADGTPLSLTTAPVFVTSVPTSMAGVRSQNFYIYFQPTALGVVNARVTLKYSNGVTGAAQQQYSFDVQGEGVAAPELTVTSTTPSAAEFGNVIKGIASAPQSVTITNNGSHPITGLARTISTGFVLTPAVPSTLAAGATKTFNVVFTPTAIGAVSGKNLIFGYTSGGVKKAATLALTGTGIEHPLPIFSESPISLGTVVTRRENTAKTVQIAYSGPLLTNARFGVSNGGIKVVSTTCPVNPTKMAGDCSVTLNTTTSLTSTGALTYNLYMYFTDGANAARTLTIPVTMTSKSPAILVATPASFSFGTLNRTNPILPEKIFVVENRGGVAATNVAIQALAAMQPLGYRTADSTCLNVQTMEPGQTCTIAFSLAQSVGYTGSMSVPVKVDYNSGAVAPVVGATLTTVSIGFR